MKKIIVTVLLLFVPLANTFCAPPTPESFTPSQNSKPRVVLVNIMNAQISQGVQRVVTLWNKDYANPQDQIMHLMRVFKKFSDSPKMPIQLLKNKTYQLQEVLDSKKMITHLEALQKQINITYHVLFDYASLLAKTKEGNIDQVYGYLLQEMPRMIESYNSVAKVTNQEYGSKVLPYYKLNSN